MSEATVMVEHALGLLVIANETDSATAEEFYDLMERFLGHISEGRRKALLQAMADIVATWDAPEGETS